MSKMLRLELVGLVLLACTQILTEHRDFYGPYNQYGHQRYQQDWEVDRIKELRVHQGRLRGIVVRPMTNPRLQLVDVFLGVPYAEPPVGGLRFSPPKSPQPWRYVRKAQEFAPVCPQVLPNLRLEVKPARHEYLERLLPYLRNQSEDCLYLNIYAPHQNDGPGNPRRYPVMVFIQGESFEWNSGNPYDGTVISAYGNVVFVTINFRLGILGFLRPGTSDDAASNFGLLDQTAALLWLRENIAKFGGDPNSMTLIGHGTGAIFANLLLISPVANNKGLFRRAILMSGSALSSDAIGKAPLQMTLQVARALNCPTTNDNELALCLRNRDLDSLLNVKIDKPRYVPAYAPLIDRAVIPMKPLTLMENAQLFGSFDLMYGVTESEKYHLLSPTNALLGMLDQERDNVLRDHAKATHELEPELAVSKILEHYGDFSEGYPSEYMTKNRDLVLDALSDSGTVAPLITVADLHSRANPKSYMYVFTHPKAMQDYSAQQQQRTVHGEELPYVLGIPLDGNRYQSSGRYNIGETLFSEAIMTWWCNFAHTGESVNDFNNFQLLELRQLIFSRQFEFSRLATENWPAKSDRIHYAHKGWMAGLRERRARGVGGWQKVRGNIDAATRGNPNAPRRLTYMTDGPKEWLQYEIDWPEYSPGNRTYFNLTIPPNVGTMYRASETQFWNEDLPNLIRHRPKGPRPRILIHADSMGNNSSAGGPRLSPDSSNDPPGSLDTFRYPHPVKSSNNDEKNDFSAKPENGSVQGSSAVTLVIGFCVIFALINITAFLYLYHRRHSVKSEEKKVRRRSNNEKDEGSSKRTKPDKQHPDNVADLGQKSESKVDISEVIKNDKAYDNNSNFGRRSKLSRHNSNSTIDTHIKVKEWIQQEIVHRCSPRFLRKTRETLQKEHQEKLTKQQELEEDEDRRRSEDERLNGLKAEPIYEQSPALVVRPGKKSKLPKVSVAIDATPAMRTESILNQIPIELAKDMEMINELGGSYDMALENIRSAPQVVVIEHHHSRSDPLPMENVFKSVKPNFSATRIYESDSGSASSLYAKINPKLKTRMTRAGQPGTPEEEATDDQQAPQTPDEDPYGKTVPKLRTFGSTEQAGDINVTCREPARERELISPEEALRTIKRRNYPKVLPDIEKRRSLPAPNSLFVPKVYGTLSKDHRHAAGVSGTGNPPPPPPRMFGTSKSLDLAEEVEEREPITTNLHVGPLLKRQDSTSRNNSDPNLIDSFERVAIDAQEVLSNHRVEYGDNLGSGGIPANPKCPLHGAPYLFSTGPDAVETNTSQSVDCLDRNLGNPNWYRMKDSAGPSKVPNSSLPDIIGNPNWYKPAALLKGNTKKDESTGVVGSAENNFDTGRSLQNETKSPAEPKIVITPRLGNLLGQSGQNLSHAVSSLTTTKNIPQEPKIVITPKKMLDRSVAAERGKISEPTTPTNEQNCPLSYPTEMPASTREERHEPKIIITPKDSKHPGPVSNIKQPKIIIKPTTNVQRNREQRNIPKVSAIPSPEAQNFQNTEKDTKGPDLPLDGNSRYEKPPIKEKPKVTRIPSFSRRKEERSGGADGQSVYLEKSEVIQRVNAVPMSKITTNSSNTEKSNATTHAEKKSDSSASTSNSSNSNTNTIKRKPLAKK